MMDFDDGAEAEISALEYLIFMGARGSHLLFDNESIRETFSKDQSELVDLGAKLMDQVKEAVQVLLQIPEFEAKKEFISSLPPELRHVLVFLYFQMVEKTAHLNQKLYH